MIRNFGQFIYRVPLHSIELLHKAKNYAKVEDYLREVLVRKEIQEAIYLASPVFFQEMNKFLEGHFDEKTDLKRTLKFTQSALKYINRMACRSTPFGLFAGCGTGSISNGAGTIELDGVKSFRRKSRLDSKLLVQLAETLEADLAVRSFLFYFPNNTLYLTGNQYRYVEFYNNKKGDRQYELSSFSNSPYIKAILETSQTGQTIRNIAAPVTKMEIDEDVAISFIGELIDAKILISELEPPVIGDDYGTYLLQVLKQVYSRSIAAKATAAQQARIEQYIQTLQTVLGYFSDTENIGDLGQYRDIRNIAQAALGNQLPKSLVQVDSEVVSTSAAKISPELARSIKNGLQLFAKFCRTHDDTKLKKFKEKFEERYDRQMVPLAEVLDPELGLGFTKGAAELYDVTPFVDDLPVPSRKSSNNSRKINWDFSLHSFLLKRIMQAQHDGQSVIELSDAEMERFNYDVNKFPPTFNAFVSVIPQEENEEPLIYYHGTGKDTASSFLGRFGHLNEEVHHLLEEICSFEEKCFPEKAVAEINHLSDPRIGNIAFRPKTRRYEIPYVTKSNSTEEGLIPVDDIYIGVRNNKLVLYSKALDKEIIPRLSNAHNYFYNTLPVYRFLAHLQEENADGYYQLFMNMGSISRIVDHIPRFQYKNFIFRKASWTLKTEVVKKIKHLPLNDVTEKLRAYFTAHNIPSVFYIKKLDTQFYIDLNNPATVLVFLDEGSKGSEVTLEECLFANTNEYLINNKDGGVFHEMIVPFRNENLIKKAPAARKHRPMSSKITRHYMPACEWFYLKIYAGFRRCDELVTNTLPNFLKEVQDKGMISRWFFIRYNDPDFHLRLRFQLNAQHSLDELMTVFYRHFDDEIRSKQVWKVCIDTYERELERYAGSLINAAEEIFHLDSSLCVTALHSTQETALSNYRWLIACRIIKAYLNAFEMDLEMQQKFLKEERTYFAHTFNADKNQKRKISQKYMSYRPQLEKVLEQGFAGLFEDGDKIDHFISHFEKEVNAVYRQAYADKSQRLLFEQLGHFIHMSVLRLVRSKNKLHEYLLYALLEQHTRATIGKLKAMQHHV